MKNQESAPDGQRGRCFAPWVKAVENATRLRASLTAFTHFAPVDHRTHYRGRFEHLLQQDQEHGRCYAPWVKAVENAARLHASLTAFTHFVHPPDHQLQTASLSKFT